MREILTCAEIAQFAELDAERTQGAWTDYGNDWHNVQRPDGSLIPCGHGPAAQEDTAFIAACSVMVPRLLATIKTLIAVILKSEWLLDASECLDESEYTTD